MFLERKLKQILFSLFIIFTFLPYIKIIGFGNTTVQPTGLFFSFFPLLLLKNRKLPPLFYYFIFIAFFTILFIIEAGINFTSIRDWVNYFALAIISIASFKLFHYLQGNFYNIFRFCIYVWGFVALVHYFINPSFLTFLLSSNGGALSGGRGVTSLATEPSYYGLIMVSYLSIYFINGWYKKNRWLGFIIVFQLIFFSRASTAMVAFLGAIIIFLLINLLRFNLRIVLFSLLLAGVFGVIISSFSKSIEETRIYEVGKKLAENPQVFIGLDYSINSRFLSVVLPLISLYENKFLPRGFSKYSDFYRQKLKDEKYSSIFVNPGIRAAVAGYTSKAESGYGKTFFELGFLGVLIFVFMTVSLSKVLLSDNYFLFGYVLFSACMFMAFPWTTPIAPFIVANLFYRKKKLSRIYSNRYQKLKTTQ